MRVYRPLAPQAYAAPTPVRFFTGLRDGVKVDVYYNLHKHVLSLRHNGLVQAHSPTAFLSNVEFIVNQAGRQRVLAEGRKNVHAFVRGFTRQHPPAELANLRPIAVTYNPFMFPTFVERGTNRPIFHAKYVAIVDKAITAWV